MLAHVRITWPGGASVDVHVDAWTDDLLERIGRAVDRGARLSIALVGLRRWD
jgi:hypothetical protein